MSDPVPVMIEIDPHKYSHTAVAIGAGEEVLDELRVRADRGQVERLLAWSESWSERAPQRPRHRTHPHMNSARELVVL